MITIVLENRITYELSLSLPDLSCLISNIQLGFKYVYKHFYSGEVFSAVGYLCPFRAWRLGVVCLQCRVVQS